MAYRATERCETLGDRVAASCVADFRKLRVWQASQTLAIDAHGISGRMRGANTTALSDQLTRAAMSVPANIVEGSAHASPREFARFVQYALASVSELEAHAQLASDLQLISEQDLTSLLSGIVDVRKMLHGLLKALRARG
jgi:four helix bundle protein